jgi:hypothetical protein
MSEFSAYGLGGSQNPAYYDDFGNEGLLSLTEKVITDTDDGVFRERYANYLLDAPPNPLSFQEFKSALQGIGVK